MEEKELPLEPVENCFAALRRAVEERNYPALEQALQQQRTLITSARPGAPATRALILQGSALISWALTMVKIQHAGYAQDVAAILNAKRLFSQYIGASATESEHISISA